MTSPNVAYVSIGSNIEPERNLQKAVDLLRDHCEVIAISSVYQSPPFGFTEQPDFLDITIKVHTTLSPLDFKMQVLAPIEKACGRDRASQLNKYGPLALDMDILLWNDSAFEFGEKPWRVPNSGITKFAAVALPLAEIAADVIHPLEGETITRIAARFPASEAEGVRKLPLVIR